MCDFDGIVNVEPEGDIDHSMNNEPDTDFDFDEDIEAKTKSFKTITIVVFSILGLLAIYAGYTLITSNVDWGFKINWNFLESPLAGPCMVIGFFLQFTKPFRFHSSMKEMIKGSDGKWRQNYDIMSVMFYSFLMPILSHLILAPLIIGGMIWYAVAGVIALIGKLAPYLLTLLLIGFNVLGFIFVKKRDELPKRYYILIAASLLCLSVNLGTVYLFSNGLAFETETVVSNKVIVTGNSVNLRMGPGTEYGKFSLQAQKNAVYDVLGEEGDWYNVRCQGESVWINKKFCQLRDANMVSEATVKRSSVESSSVTSTSNSVEAVEIAAEDKQEFKIVHPIEGATAMRGKLDNKYEIVMQVTRPDENNVVTGEYYYTKYNSPISLTGIMEADGTLRLEERTNGNLTGRFIGSFMADGFYGVWESADSARTMSLLLHYLH